MSTAVVVGSGPNGLAAAIRLAEKGVSVTVLEAHERPGGGSRTGELTLPGVLHDECSAVHPTGVASPYFRSLDLERRGLRWLWPTVDLAHPLDDGRAGLAARDLTFTDRSLGQDARTWHRLFGPSARRFEALAEDVFGPVVHLPRHPFALARFGIPALASTTTLVRAFHDEPARALFTGMAAHAFGRLDRPLSSAVGTMFAASAHSVGWPVAEGGSGSIVRALVAELEEYGGRVVTDTRVDSLDDLREYADGPLDVVMLDTSVTGAVEILGDRLPPRVRRSLERFRFGPAAFKVDIAIDGDIPWRNPDCRRAGTVHLGGTAAEIAAAEADTSRGRMPARPFVLLSQQYLIDRTRSSPTANPIYAYAHVPHGFEGDATQAVIEQIERFAPGFRERILAVTSRGPLELAAYNANYVGGDISAGANTARQLIARPRLVRPYSLGVPGIYLCSSATPPGGGVHGMGGFHAAEAALRELG